MSLVVQTVAWERRGEPLRFGVWQLVHRSDVWMGARSGVFYADELAAAEVAELRELCAARRLPEPQPRKQFVDQVLYRAVFKQELALVGLFLPVDLGRLAVDWSKADSGGISLTVWTHPKPARRAKGSARRRPALANGEVENSSRPRVVVLMLDGQRPLIEFTRAHDPDAADLIAEGSDGEIDPRYRKRGRFHSLAMHASALTGSRIETLAEACETFGIEPPTPCLGRDLASRLDAAWAELAATVELNTRLLAEHERVAPGLLAPDRAYSAASYGRAFLNGAGITPPLLRNPDFPRPALGASMGAFFGGECAGSVRATREPLPCEFLDYTSLYPVVAKLQAADAILKADRLEVVEEDPAELAAWLATLTDEQLFTPGFHASLALRFVELTPDGQWLPHRLPAGKHWKLQVGPLSGDEPRWFALADIVRATLKDGPPLRIAQACGIAAVGRQRGLWPVRLPSGRIVDPDEDLLFALAEERLDGGSWQGAKTCANTCSFGLFAQTDTSETPGQKLLQHVWLPDGRLLYERGADVEAPGRWYFPPLAASITAGARLLLYLAGRLVEQAGGTVAYVDTDALAVVATRDGGLVVCPGGPERNEQGADHVRALSFAEVDAIRDRLEALNPYTADHGQPPRLLKIEADNIDPDGLPREAFLHARSTKNYDRYITDNDGGVAITKPSEHGLGHLHPHWPEPGNWIREGRTYLLQADLALPAKAPECFDATAISLLRITSWKELQRLNPTRSRRRRGKGLRPFARIAVAHVNPLYRDENGERVVPVASWHDGLTPEDASWHDLRDGRHLKLRPTATQLRERDLTVGGAIPVQTIRDVFNQLAQRHDHGLDHTGRPTSPNTSGIIKPAVTQAIATIAIGRETHDSDRVGITTDPAYRTYTDPDGNAWQLARDTLRKLAPGLLRPGRPREADKRALIQHAGELARRELAKTGEVDLPTDPIVACHRYLSSTGHLRTVCERCGRRLSKRERRWCAECRPHRKRLDRGA